MLWKKIILITYTLFVIIFTMLIMIFCEKFNNSPDNEFYQVGYSDGFKSGAEFVADHLPEDTKIIIIK